MLFKRLFAAVAVSFFVSTLVRPKQATAETWTSLQGTHSVEARMIGLWDEKVLLQLSNGRRVAVPLMSLRSESRIQAQELARKLDSARAERIRELQGRAVAEAAPAPDPLPQPPAADNYVPPAPGANAAQFLQQLDDAVAAGHVRAIYDALPPSYRSDIDSLAQLAAQRIKPSTWQALAGAAHRVGDLLVTRQNWFFSSSRMDALEPEEVEQVRGQVLAFANVLRVGLSPDVTQIERMQATPFSQWLGERDQAIAPHLAQFFKYSDSLGRAIKVDSEKDGVAEVSLTQGSTTSKVTYVSVDGYWVPKTLADQWSGKVESWKKELSEGAASLDTYATLIQAAAGPALQNLASAQNAGQFHAAMEPVFPLAETTIGTVAAMFGKSGGLASSQGRGGYGDEGYGDYEDGYGDGYEDEMGMDMEEEYGDEPGYPGGTGSGPRGLGGPASDGGGPRGLGGPASDGGGGPRGLGGPSSDGGGPRGLGGPSSDGGGRR